MGVVIPQVVSEDRASGAQIVDGGLRFDSSKSHYLSRTPGSAGNRKTWTWSGWVKRTKLGTYQRFFSARNPGVAQEYMRFNNDDTITISHTSEGGTLVTTQVFRDISSSYHIVVSCDTTIASPSSDRIKIYVNGTRVTAFSGTYPNQNADFLYNSAVIHNIATGDGTTEYTDALISNQYFIDGQALGPGYFGYTDPLTNTWRPKKLSSSIAFGTNGFYLPFDGSAPIGQDQSGQGNNWTPVNFGGSTSLEKATGALPILNTDGGGKTARPGVFGSEVSKYYTLTGSSNSSTGYVFENEGTKPTLSMIRGTTHTFDYTSATSHPLYLSSLSDGKHNAKAYSVSFDGTGDRLTTANSSSDFTFGTGDFTVEGWFYQSDTNERGVFQISDTSGGLKATATGVISLQYNSGESRYKIYAGGVSTGGAANGRISGWVHFAVVRNSSTTKLYLNGVEDISVSDSTNYATTYLCIGGYYDTSYLWNGYISNLRVIKGTALYTSNFTPPTTTLTNVTNTVLLCCQDSDATTAVVSPGAITANGDAAATNTYNPFVYNVDNYFGVDTSTSNVTKMTVPHYAPDTLYYYCNVHSGMGNSISVTTDTKKADPYAWKNVLGLPLIGSSSDVSNQINSGSTTKTITTVNVVASYTQSNFYGGSYYFDGTGDYVITNSSTDFGFGTGDFTLECWVYCTRTGDYQGVLSNRPDSTSGTSININNTNLVEFQVATNTATSPNVMPTNRWVHLALTRSGTTCRGFIDGVNVATFTSSGNDGSSNIYNMGRYYYNSDRYYFQGYIQDARIYKGTAKYTSNFIPASTDPDIVPDTPSGVSYSSNLTQITDGAVSFDGSGDYLSIADSADWDHQSSFTWEFFVYVNAYDTGGVVFIEQKNDSGVSGMQLYSDTNGNITFNRNSSATLLSSGNNALILNKWNHIAVSHDGTTIRMFVDGILKNSSTTSTVPDNVTGPLLIGKYNDDSNYDLNGYISNLRFVNGTALYTSNFTPPSAPLTAVANTKLLCCQSNTSAGAAAVSPTVTDNYSAGVSLTATPYADIGGSNCTITNNGTVTSSSAGTNSFGLTNAADMTGTQRVDINMGNVSSTFFQSAWTLEMFFKTSNNNDSWFVGTATDGSSYTTGWSIESTSGTIRWNYNNVGGGTQVDTNISISTNTWYFMRVQRVPGPSSATSLAIYVYSSPTTLVGSYIANQQDNGTHTNNILKIGDANGNANNLNGNWQFANVMITAGTVAYQNVPSLSSGVRTDSVIVSSEPIPNGNASATNFNPFTTDINAVRGQESGYCTLNPLKKGAHITSVSNGNLQFESTGASQYGQIWGTIAVNSGKWYWEGTELSGGGIAYGWGLESANALTSEPGGDANTWVYLSSGYKYNSGSIVAYGLSSNDGDTIGVAFNADNGELSFYKNGIYMGVAYTLTTGRYYAPVTGDPNSSTNCSGFINFGQKPFKFPPPAGFQPLTLANTPRPTIVRPDQYVGIVTYTGSVATGSATPGVNEPPTRTGFLFKPDFLWIKERNQAFTIGHRLYDSVRGLGVNKHLNSSSTNAEGVGNDETYGYVTGFVDGGFTSANGTSGNDYVNSSATNYVVWAWKAGHPSTPTTGAVSFDGSGDYLSLADSDDWHFGSGDFTIEAFVYLSSTALSSTIASQYGLSNSFFFSINTNTLYFYYYGGTTGSFNGGTVPTAKWTHVAVTRSGDIFRLFVDGVQTATTTLTSFTFTNSTEALRIGGDGTYDFNGFVSNFHFVNGTALYTSNFTPPTEPLTAVANTKLLCCQSTTSATASAVSPGAITAVNAVATTYNPLDAFSVDGTGYSTASAAGLNAGTITPTGASVNTKSGFSIITYTGNGTDGATVGHGLNVEPHFLIIKDRDASTDWAVFHKYNTPSGAADPSRNSLYLNQTYASANNNSWPWNNTLPSSSVFTLNNSGSTLKVNTNGNDYVAYCWAEIPGFSKFGSYIGDGSETGFGPFIQTGFRPRYVLIKSTTVAYSWLILDAVRNPYNLTTQVIYADTSGTEITNNGTGTGGYESIDILSNGFQIKSNSSRYNQSGQTYIYAAFAEAPTFNLYGAQANAR